MNLVGQDRFYDPGKVAFRDSGPGTPCLGGTTTFVYDMKKKISSTAIP